MEMLKKKSKKRLLLDGGTNIEEMTVIVINSVSIQKCFFYRKCCIVEFIHTCVHIIRIRKKKN